MWGQGELLVVCELAWDGAPKMLRYPALFYICLHTDTYIYAYIFISNLTQGHPWYFLGLCIVGCHRDSTLDWGYSRTFAVMDLAFLALIISCLLGREEGWQ